MSAVTIELPDALRQGMQALAEEEGKSLEQFLTVATAEWFAAKQGLDFLRREAAQGKREDFDRVMAAVPDVEPEDNDRLPD